ncbi:hypothetical protein ABTO99_18580, partial [Acinetobacter baumannii]
SSVPASAAPHEQSFDVPARSLGDAAEDAFTRDLDPPPRGAYGLLGLRDLPVLGRPVERRAIWRAVRRAVMEQKPVVVVLTG